MPGGLSYTFKTSVSFVLDGLDVTLSYEKQGGDCIYTGTLIYTKPILGWPPVISISYNDTINKWTFDG